MLQQPLNLVCVACVCGWVVGCARRYGYTAKEPLRPLAINCRCHADMRLSFLQHKHPISQRRRFTVDAADHGLISPQTQRHLPPVVCAILARPRAPLSGVANSSWVQVDGKHLAR